MKKNLCKSQNWDELILQIQGLGKEAFANPRIKIRIFRKSQDWDFLNRKPLPCALLLPACEVFRPGLQSSQLHCLLLHSTVLTHPKLHCILQHTPWLQFSAPHCTASQYIALSLTELHWISLSSSWQFCPRAGLPGPGLHIIVLYCATLYCTVLYCTMHITLLYCTVLFCSLLFLLYCTVVLYCTIL